MALSRQERFALLFKDELVEGQLPRLPGVLGETHDDSSPTVDTFPLTNPSIPQPSQEVRSPSYGENIEPVTWSSNDENEPGPGSTTASGKRKRKKKGKQEVTITAAKAAITKSSPASNSTPDLGLKLGELAASDETFCPILAVSKYPYKYVDKELSEVIADGFFNAGKFWERTWDIYYIHPPPSVAAKPMFLVPSTQVQILFTEINKELDCEVSFPKAPRYVGFNLPFEDKAAPRPRYLGRSNSRTSFDDMTSNVPQAEFRPEGEVETMEKATTRSFAAFKQKMEAALEATKSKSKASKAKKQGERIQQKQKWCRELKRAQRYLGLRPKRTATAKDDPLQKHDLSWTQLQEAREEHALAAGQILPQLDINEPVPYPCDRDVVFICVDVEAYERGHNTITEIGISTLDTRDLVNIPPGEDGKGWRDVIRSRHFRIREYAHLINKDFVAGCADRFEFNNNQSEWISIKDAPQTVAACFRSPFSANLNGTPESHQTPTTQAAAPAPEKRNIILLGHDITQDITYLQTLGYNPLNLSNLLEILDTASLYRALLRDNNPRSLGAVLLDLGIAGWNLHNAGNDAAYTLQAMIGIAMRALRAKEERRDREEVKVKRVEDAVREAEERVLEEAEGWSSPEEGDDGGSPYSVVRDVPSSGGGPSRGQGGGRSGSPSRGGRGGAMGRGQENAKTRRAEKMAKEQAEARKDVARHLAAQTL